MLQNISFMFDEQDIQTERRLNPVQQEVTSIESGEDDEKAFVALEITSIEKGGDDEKAFVVLEGDPQVYDSGKMLTVVYRHNKTWPDATENHILDLDFIHGDKHGAVMDALDTVLPNISQVQFYDTITRVTLETVEGKLTADISEDVEEITSYLPVPIHLSHITTVLITELLKVKHLAMFVDCVSWNGQHFAFKRTDKDFLEGTIQELTILDKLRDSRYIIDLIAIVVNNDGCVRGFLMPYMFAGDLTNVFQAGRKFQGLPDEDDESRPVFEWSLRLSWACQVTKGVVDLHSIASYNGDLKPTNVLVNQSGQAILIDFLPMGITDEFAAPELLAKLNQHRTDQCCNALPALESVLTAATDIYSLGLMLYTIALEKTHGSLHVPLDYVMTQIPTWYQDIVKRCIVQNPADRPFATEVLSLLEKGACESGF